MFIFLMFNLLLISVCIAYLSFSFVFSKRFILRSYKAKKCSDPKILNMINRLSIELKIQSVPKVYIFKGSPNAFVFGYPVSLVISKELINCLSKDELRIALLHELAHIKNKDFILKPLLQSLRILFFYNPLVHLLYYKMINERELMADSLFINSKADKIIFMEVLVKIHDYIKHQGLSSKTIYGSCSLMLVSYHVRPVKLSFPRRSFSSASYVR